MENSVNENTMNENTINEEGNARISEDDLGLVDGGSSQEDNEYAYRYCDNCKTMRLFKTYSGGRMSCTVCKKIVYDM